MCTISVCVSNPQQTSPIETVTVFDRVRTEHVPHDQEGHDIEDELIGPMNTIKEQCPASHLRGCLRKSASTWSTGSTPAKYRKEDFAPAVGSGASAGRAEDAGDQHTEHVAEIRARRHFDVFDDVGKRLAPFDDCLFQVSKLFSNRLMSADPWQYRLRYLPKSLRPRP
jgi:hypothetical protein